MTDPIELHAAPSQGLPARALGLSAMLLTLAACDGAEGASGSTDSPDVYEVTRRTMSVRVTESAELKAAKETRIRSEIEGSSTILFLVPEGKVVEKDEKLVELDVSELEERRATQAISVERAYASLVNARQNLEILQKELDSLKAAARSQLEIAQIDVEKFFGRPAASGDNVRSMPTNPDFDSGAARGVGPSPTGARSVRGTNRDMLTALVDLVANTPYAGLPQQVLELFEPTGPGLDGLNLDEMLDRDMGELGQQILEQVDQITIAKQQLAIAKGQKENSEVLFDDEYITKNDLDRDRLDFDSKSSNVRLAEQNLDLLISYTLRKTRIDLTLKLDNAALELDKVQASNAARRTREEAELASIESEYNLAKERLENLDYGIAHAVLTAPTPGLVVYASLDSRGREMVEEGADIRERQTILVLPDVSRMQAELKIQEADIDKVRRNQGAVITVDAFPGESFTGKVTRVSPIADSGSRWSNSNLKVYKTWVSLERANEDGQLRPNMAAKVTIHIGDIDDALPVPITAVRRQGKVNYVWKRTSSGPEAVPVKVGRSTNEEVNIVEGLEAGDLIFKAPPSGVTVPELEQPEEEVESEAVSEETEEERAEREELQKKVENVTRESFMAEVKTRLPQFKEEIESGNPGVFWSNSELRTAIQDDPVLSAMQSALMKSFSGGRGRRPGGGGGRSGGGGGRPGGGGGRPGGGGGPR